MHDYIQIQPKRKYLILASIYDFLVHCALLSFEKLENHVFTSSIFANTRNCLSKFHWRSLNMSKILVLFLVLVNCTISFLKLHYCTILVHSPPHLTVLAPPHYTAYVRLTCVVGPEKTLYGALVLILSRGK
jgi:hypothetical protein